MGFAWARILGGYKDMVSVQEGPKEESTAAEEQTTVATDTVDPVVDVQKSVTDQEEESAEAELPVAAAEFVPNASAADFIPSIGAPTFVPSFAAPEFVPSMSAQEFVPCPMSQEFKPAFAVDVHDADEDEPELEGPKKRVFVDRAIPAVLLRRRQDVIKYSIDTVLSLSNTAVPVTLHNLDSIQLKPEPLVTHASHDPAQPSSSAIPPELDLSLVPTPKRRKKQNKASQRAAMNGSLPLLKVTEEHSPKTKDFTPKTSKNCESPARQNGRSHQTGGGNTVPMVETPVEPLKISASRWCPKRASGDEAAIKTARSILNKLTPEKFDKLVGQFCEIKVESSGLLRKLVDVVFKKATDEPEFAGIYGNFCERLSESLPTFNGDGGDGDDDDKVSFRRILLGLCLELFVDGPDESGIAWEELDEEETKEKRLRL